MNPSTSTPHMHTHTAGGGAGPERHPPTCPCSAHPTPSPCTQTLEELDWSRTLHGACSAGRVERIRALVARHPAAVHAPDAHGYLPLHYAARRSGPGGLEACACLLAAGAHVDAATRGNGTTALHRAGMGGAVDIVRLLLRHGASLELRDGRGQDARYFAAAHPDPGIRALLLAALEERGSGLPGV
jgi:hypothetical protein